MINLEIFFYGGMIYLFLEGMAQIYAGASKMVKRKPNCDGENIIVGIIMLSIVFISTVVL